MKLLFTFLFLAFLLASCKMEEPTTYKTYPIHIQISRIKAPGTKLVISDTNTGEVLYFTGLPQGPTEFKGTFDIGEDLGVKNIDIHLVSPKYEYLNWISKSSIETYLAVPIGTFVNFSPFESFAQPKRTAIKVNDINEFDSLSTGHVLPGKIVHDPVANTLYADVYIGDSYGCLLRVKANSSPEFMYYYLPESLAEDTVQLKWSDFKQEKDFRQIIFPSTASPVSYIVDAVSPDFSKAISICAVHQTQLAPEFNLPDILPSDWLLHVRMSMGGRICRHIFTQQEPLVFHTTDIKLDGIEVSGNHISVSTSGDVDWATLTGDSPDLSWSISGSELPPKNWTVN